jgi:hypothetical protein
VSEDFTTWTDAELFEEIERLLVSLASGTSQDPAVTTATMRTVHQMFAVINSRLNTA